jgi:hypothetical protein
MRSPGRLIVAAIIGGSVFVRPDLARGECDPAKPAEPIAPRFEIHSDTVYDNSTDLTWMRCSYGQQWMEGSGCAGSVKLVDWDSAMALQSQIDPAWRLPKRDELQSIVVHNCKSPAINETVFPRTEPMQYWTSTPSGPSYAWIVFFRTGMPTWNFLKTTPLAVRLVRTGH